MDMVNRVFSYSIAHFEWFHHFIFICIISTYEHVAFFFSLFISVILTVARLNYCLSFVMYSFNSLCSITSSHNRDLSLAEKKLERLHVLLFVFIYFYFYLFFSSLSPDRVLQLVITSSSSSSSNHGNCTELKLCP